MSEQGEAAPSVAASQGPRLYSSVAAGLILCAGIVGGAAAGMLPAIIARKTLLAPQPDAGLGDIGPALVSLAAGAVGGIVGAVIGLLVSTRWIKRADVPTATPRVRSFGVVVFVLVSLPFAIVLLIIVPFIGVLVLATVCLVGTAHVLGAASPSKR
jgi:hypothetical protein